VHRQFGPLAARWGLEGPIDDGIVLATVSYHLDRLSYIWMLDDEDRELSVRVALVVAEGQLTIPLDDLVPGLGLAPRQQVRSSARTWHGLQQAIDSHTRWLEHLHPQLTSPDAPHHLERAGARLFAPDLD
jgi:hypothetical protein